MDRDEGRKSKKIIPPPPPPPPVIERYFLKAWLQGVEAVSSAG